MVDWASGQWSAPKPPVRTFSTTRYLTRQGYLDGMTDPRNSPPGASRLQSLCCSFCTKDKDAVAKLIAGPGVYICDECVSLCDLIIYQPLAPALGSWNDHPGDEIPAILARTA